MRIFHYTYGYGFKIPFFKYGLFPRFRRFAKKNKFQNKKLCHKLEKDNLGREKWGGV